MEHRLGGRARPRQFRKVVGYRDLAKLAVAVEREVAATATAHHAKEAVTV